MEENQNLQQPLVANNGNNNQRKCPTSIYPNTLVKEIDFVIFFLELISIVPSVLIFIFSRQIYFDGEVTRAIAIDLYDNLNTGFFTDFSDCSENNEFNFLFDTDKSNKISEDKESNEIPLSFGEWQGTVQACKNINDKMHILEPGKSCGEDQKLIDKIPPVKLYKYKGLKICSLSDDSLSYYDMLQKPDTIISQYQECPKNKKSCGYIDTLKNILCMDLNDECPVNYIRVSKKPPIEDIEDLKEIKSDQISFYYSHNPYPNSTKIPYITNTFKIADSHICSLPNLYYSEIILNDLEAAKKNYSTNCVLNDFSQRQTVDLMRYHKLDLIDNYELYEENNIIKKIKQKELDKFGFDFERYKNHSLYLYIRNHYGFNYTCLKEREEKGEHNALEELQSSYARADKMLAWSTLTFGMNFAPTIASGFNIITFFNNKEIFFKQLITIGFSAFNLIYTSYKVNLDDPFADKMTCSDIVTNDEYNIMNEKIRNSGQSISSTYKCIIAQFVIYIVTYIWMFGKWLFSEGCLQAKCGCLINFFNCFGCLNCCLENQRNQENQGN